MKSTREINEARQKLIRDTKSFPKSGWYELKAIDPDRYYHVAFVSGKLENVIEYALQLDRFWNYGAGLIECITFINVDSIDLIHIKHLSEELQTIESRRSYIINELKNMGVKDGK